MHYSFIHIMRKPCFQIFGNMEISGILKFENPEMLKLCMFVGIHVCGKTYLRL